ncbi:MAG: hypothetical protein ACC700_20650, partial [Anaerolineales bacterium]
MLIKNSTVVFQLFSALVFALIAVVVGPVCAGPVVVTYNPYAGVNWSTVLRCQSQHHDHIKLASWVLDYDAAGYDAVTFMTYSGYNKPSTLLEWQALGSPNMDPGQPKGWVEYRRWPPTDHGAPSPATLTNIKFYIPGAEEIGLLPDGGRSLHIHSAFLETYIEGAGCNSCGVGGIPVARNNFTPTNPAGLPDYQRYTNTQELIDRINFYGGHATLNHPTDAIGNYAPLENFGSFEIFNNFMALRDEGDGGSRVAQMLGNWDYLLETKSSKIWGVATNDWFGAFTNPRPAVNGLPPLTEQNLDRGKLQVMVTSYDLPSYRTAFEAGAFFAVREDNAIKGAYPQVTGVSVSPTSIELTTTNGNEVVIWIGNGEIVGSGMSLWLNDLPPGLKYVRAEIDDLQGRQVFTQPFSLGVDSDGDGLSDAAEAILGTNPNYADTDGDNVLDYFDTDDDNDGLSDSDELAIGTEKLDADTDNDGINDFIEVGGDKN